MEIHIVRDYMMTVPVKLPKRKKWRLKKKFLKRYGYKSIPMPTIEDRIVWHQDPNRLYMNPRTFDYFRLVVEKK